MPELSVEPILDDFERQLDRWGLLQNPEGGGGNGLRYLSQAVVTLAQLGILREVDRRRYAATVRACMLPGWPGVLQRTPAGGDQQGPDDIVAVMTACRVLGLDDIAAEIRGHGRRHRVWLWGWLPVRYFFNNVQPGTARHPDGRWNTSAWLGRQVQLVAHMEFATHAGPAAWRAPVAAVGALFVLRFWPALGWLWGVPLGLALLILGAGFRRLVWAGVVGLTGVSEPHGQDNHVLTWCLVHAAPDAPWWCRWAARRWGARFDRAWPGGMAELHSVYFRDPLRHHFLSRWSARR